MIAIGYVLVKKARARGGCAIKAEGVCPLVRPDLPLTSTTSDMIGRRWILTSCVLNAAACHRVLGVVGQGHHFCSVNQHFPGLWPCSSSLWGASMLFHVGLGLSSKSWLSSGLPCLMICSTSCPAQPCDPPPRVRAACSPSVMLPRQAWMSLSTSLRQRKASAPSPWRHIQMCTSPITLAPQQIKPKV